MDNITHTLAGALLGEMGLKRRSRFAMAACLLAANAPDIDVFAPLVWPVDGIAFHRGPVHSVFAVPILAAAITGLLWLLDRLRPNPDVLPFRPGPLFLVALIAVASHPFLDWLTTYAIAIFAPISWRWYSGNAIFIIDWVYWVLMIAGIGLSIRRGWRHLPTPERPAQIAGLIMLAYIGLNLAESTWVERATAVELRSRGIKPRLIIAGPPPLAFWQRDIAWRSADRFGSGSFTLAAGLEIDLATQPLGLDNPQLVLAERTRRYVRSFLTWSRMPIVVRVDGRACLTDQRFYDGSRRAGSRYFFIPLDNGRTNS